DAEPPRAPFAFESVVGGRYTLRVEVPGFSLPPMQVVLAIGESLSLGDLRLVATPQAADAAPTGVQGVARRAGGGETGHGGIRVDVVDTPYTAATTDAGAFQLPLAPATYTLRFSADGHEPETVADVAVGTDGFTALPGEVVLQGAPARLFGRLSPPVGFDGAFDFAEVRVGLWPADAVEDAEPTTLAPVDTRGDFDLPGLDAGRYRLQARREGFLGTLALATVAPGQALEVPGLSLQAVVADEGLLAGQARLGGASDHSNIRVELVGSERSASTNADGDWALRAPPGVHTLRFTRAGYGTAQVQAPRLEAGGAAMVDPVVLAADPGSVRGQVRLDPAFGGRALLPQVAVRLARIEADGTLTAAGEAGVLPAEGDAELGTFAFENLPPSDYQVEVRLEGFQPAFRAV
ncbi:MAG: carboxypeptidase regulatory-like domain-containing protein, partial [Myxococcales bacterium]|nr:carboxypeptidase regulatory-like domain-containing protein [Myxococcales bacterium]